MRVVMGTRPSKIFSIYLKKVFLRMCHNRTSKGMLKEETMTNVVDGGVKSFKTENCVFQRNEN